MRASKLFPMLSFLCTTALGADSGTHQPIGGGIATPGILSGNPAGAVSEPDTGAFLVAVTTSKSELEPRTYSGGLSFVRSGSTVGAGAAVSYDPPGGGSTGRVQAGGDLSVRMDRVALGVSASQSFTIGSPENSGSFALSGGMMFLIDAKMTFGLALSGLASTTKRFGFGLGFHEAKRYALEVSLSPPSFGGTGENPSSSWSFGGAARLYVERFGFGYSLGTSVGGMSGGSTSHGVVVSFRFGKSTYLLVSMPLSSASSSITGALALSW